MFGDCATELWSAAAVLLGWRPDEFWNATPAELALALDPPAASAGAPDPLAIEALLKRFPD